MVSPLERKGIVSYGGFVFPTSASVKCSGVPIYDASDRIGKYTRYTITVDCIFTQDEFPQYLAGRALQVWEATGRLDEAFDFVRRILTEPSETLVATWSGIGDKFTVATGDTVDFGPKPSILLFEPIATTRAIHVVWQCVATCPDYINRALIGEGPQPYGEWNYDVSWNFSPEGLTVKTINGMLESRVKKVGQRIDQSAERFLSQLNIPLDDRFRRSQTYRLSRDKRFLHYTVVDTEIPSDNPLYPNCVSMDIKHRISSNLSIKDADGQPSLSAAGMWQVYIGGSITVAPGVQRAVAWEAFKNVLTSRIAKAPRGKAVKIAEDGSVGEGPTTIAIPVKFSIEEEVFGRTLSFSIAWRYACNLATILEGSGLWTEVPGTWNDWKTSVAIAKGNSSRGTLNASNPHTLDVIVNFNEGLIGNVSPGEVPPKGADTYSKAIFNCPEEDYSYFAYDGKATVLSRGGTVAPVKLGAYVSPGEELPKLTGILGKGGAAITNGSPGIPSSPGKAVIQQRSIGQWTVAWRGYIIRISHPLSEGDVPTLKSIGGEPAVLQNTGFTMPHKAGNLIGDCPVYVMTWSHIYHVESPASLNLGIINEPELHPLTVTPSIT